MRQDLPIDLQFITMLPLYLWRRGLQLWAWSYATAEVLIDFSAILKSQLVSRMFWGRGNLYRNAFHIVILGLTFTALVSGLATQLDIFASSPVALQEAYGLGPSNDILHQGGSIRTVLPIDPRTPEIPIRLHIVKAGETLDTIATTYKINVDTVRWANSNLISPFNSEIDLGWELKIPQIDGVLYTVRRGQTVDDIAALTGGNRIDIIEINELNPPDYVLTADQQVFVPQGSLSESEVVVAGIPRGVFTNPLTHPSCAGYKVSRGFTSYHHGIDMPKYPGCPIRAIAAGRIIYAGESPLAGFNVRIDHGGGIVSHYYHGTGEFWVRVGDRVQQGQDIMMMGTTGNSTGVHLHLGLFKNNIPVDPAIFVPL